jgi:BirA family transcriptional regulator, biotin operon repressor / biotin---[acetyl-CoA-carboxylase] ligase
VIDQAAPVFRFDSVESTMDEARRLIAEGQSAPLFVTAATQTAGRGRRGRAWVSQAGNLFCTYCADLAVPPGQAALFGFAAALAVADLADGVAGRPLARLKWPNDVLIDDGKCAGILLESEALGVDATRLFLGIGVNLIGAPSDVGQEVRALSAYGDKLSPETAFAMLRARLAHWTDVLAREGFAPLRAAWLARARGLGDVIGVTAGTERITGWFTDLTLSGELALRLDSGAERLISAGEVFFPERDSN